MTITLAGGPYDGAVLDDEADGAQWRYLVYCATWDDSGKLDFLGDAAEIYRLDSIAEGGAVYAHVRTVEARDFWPWAEAQEQKDAEQSGKRR